MSNPESVEVRSDDCIVPENHPESSELIHESPADLENRLNEIFEQEVENLEKLDALLSSSAIDLSAFSKSTQGLALTLAEKKNQTGKNLDTLKEIRQSGLSAAEKLGELSKLKFLSSKAKAALKKLENDLFSPKEIFLAAQKARFVSLAVKLRDPEINAETIMTEVIPEVTKISLSLAGLTDRVDRAEIEESLKEISKLLQHAAELKRADGKTAPTEDFDSSRQDETLQTGKKSKTPESPLSKQFRQLAQRIRLLAEETRLAKIKLNESNSSTKRVNEKSFIDQALNTIRSVNEYRELMLANLSQEHSNLVEYANVLDMATMSAIGLSRHYFFSNNQQKAKEFSQRAIDFALEVLELSICHPDGLSNKMFLSRKFNAHEHIVESSINTGDFQATLRNGEILLASSDDTKDVSKILKAMMKAALNLKKYAAVFKYGSMYKEKYGDERTVKKILEESAKFVVKNETSESGDAEKDIKEALVDQPEPSEPQANPEKTRAPSKQRRMETVERPEKLDLALNFQAELREAGDVNLGKFSKENLGDLNKLVISSASRALKRETEISSKKPAEKQSQSKKFTDSAKLCLFHAFHYYNIVTDNPDCLNSEADLAEYVEMLNAAVAVSIVLAAHYEDLSEENQQWKRVSYKLATIAHAAAERNEKIPAICHANMAAAAFNMENFAEALYEAEKFLQSRDLGDIYVNCLGIAFLSAIKCGFSKNAIAYGEEYLKHRKNDSEIRQQLEQLKSQ